MSKKAGPAGPHSTPWTNRIVAQGEEAPDQLLANPGNWRIHPQLQQRALADVLGEVGLVQTVIVNRTTGHLIDGHLRAELAIAAGQPTIPVVYVELSQDEERLVLATLDPIGAMATADRDKLRELLEGLENQNLSELLEAVARANNVALDLARGGLTDPDAVPEPPEEPISKPGDLWVLGEHRLLCGDSTRAEDVQRLMADERAVAMITDPPYLVDYTGTGHPQTWGNGGKAGAEFEKQWDHYVDPETAVRFYCDFLKTALDCALARDAAVYQCYAILRSEFIWQAWREVGLLPHQVCIWRKTRAVLTHSWFMWDFEPLMVGWPKGHQPKRKPPADAKAVWEIASGIEDAPGSIHPTMKPVELIRRPIEYHTVPGDLIYEPFCGSGTAIIAAEMTGRRCYAVELSPQFVDQAVLRWQNFSGQTATREEAA